MAEIWGAAIVATAGIGTALYGANVQRKATASTNEANRQNHLDSLRENMRRYSMQRGIEPDTGVALNTKLPLYAGVKRTLGDGRARIVRRGVAPGARTVTRELTTLSPALSAGV